MVESYEKGRENMLRNKIHATVPTNSGKVRYAYLYSLRATQTSAETFYKQSSLLYADCFWQLNIFIKSVLIILCFRVQLGDIYQQRKF